MNLLEYILNRVIRATRLPRYLTDITPASSLLNRVIRGFLVRNRATRWPNVRFRRWRFNMRQARYLEAQDNYMAWNSTGRTSALGLLDPEATGPTFTDTMRAAGITAAINPFLQFTGTGPTDQVGGILGNAFGNIPLSLQ